MSERRSYEEVNGRVATGPPIDANGLAVQTTGDFAEPMLAESLLAGGAAPDESAVLEALPDPPQPAAAMQQQQELRQPVPPEPPVDAGQVEEEKGDSIVTPDELQRTVVVTGIPNRPAVRQM